MCIRDRFYVDLNNYTRLGIIIPVVSNLLLRKRQNLSLSSSGTRNECGRPKWYAGPEMLETTDLEGV